MERRNFLKTVGIGSMGAVALRGQAKFRRKAGVNLRNSAENVILVSLTGAPSHIDTFDLKKGAWTPSDFNPASVGNIELASGLFPNLLGVADKFSLLRCINGNEAVHDRARYVLETAHTFNPTFAREQPHIGSVVAYELAGSRKESDVLPPFLSINANVQGAGMLPATYAPFVFSAGDGVPGLSHPAGEEVFAKRYAALQAVDLGRTNESPQGAAISDYRHFFDSGKAMMYQPDVTEALTVTEAETSRYGATGVGAACAMAVKTLGLGRGTRFIQISHGSWDHHYDIYDRNVAGNLYDLCGQLDPALAAMLADLAGTPGQRGGSLLDETLVLAVGEFGRTPAGLSNNLGRDHYQYAWSGLVAGGGIVPGQVFGGTDPEGWYITDPFWNQGRYITMQDLIATIYSSLGIDWTKEIEDTPSGRVYEYTPVYEGASGYYTDIVEMFQS